MFPSQLYVVIGAAGLLTCIASLIALHILPTGFEPFADAVSNYALSSYGFLYRLQAFSSGVCGLCLLAWFADAGLSLSGPGIAALTIYSFSRLLIIFFPTDLNPPRTVKGTIHMILAAGTFTGIAIATGSLTSSLRDIGAWSNIAPALNAAATLTEAAAVAFLVVVVIRPFRKILGLVERGIYLGTLLWLGLVFAHLIFSL